MAAWLLLLLPLLAVLGPSHAASNVRQVVLDADGNARQLGHKQIVRKEPFPGGLTEEEALVLSKGQDDQLDDLMPDFNNDSKLNTSSDIWKKIRQQAKITAVEPFAADVPPTVVSYTETESSSAALLIAMITVVMGIFCLTQVPIPLVKLTSWKLVSDSLALFCAILVYFVIRDITNLSVSDETVSEEVPRKHLSFMQMDAKVVSQSSAGATGAWAWQLDMSRFLAGYIVLQATLVYCRTRPFHYMVASLFGSQLVGFMAADAFAGWQESYYWSSEPFFSFAIAVITAANLLLLAAIMRALRNIVRLEEGKGTSAREAWLHACTRCDEHIVAIAVALTFVQFLRFAISGRVPHYHGVQRLSNSDQPYIFLVISVATLAVAVISDKIIRALQAMPTEPATQFRRFLHWSIGAACVTPRVFSMMAAWCAYYWTQFALYYLSKNHVVGPASFDMLVETEMAVAATIMCFVVTLPLAKLCEVVPRHSSAINVVAEPFLFVMCLCWSSALRTALTFSTTKSAEPAWQVIEICSTYQYVLLLLIPAWLLFVVPTMLKLQTKGDGEEEGEEDDEDGEAEDDDEEDDDDGDGGEEEPKPVLRRLDASSVREPA